MVIEFFWQNDRTDFVKGEINNERDISIDTTENAMLKLLRSQTSGILNIPQGCHRIRDIFIVEISRQHWTHISKQ